MKGFSMLIVGVVSVFAAGASVHGSAPQRSEIYLSAADYQESADCRRALIETASTPEEHLRIVEHYDAQAAQLEAKARDHEDRAGFIQGVCPLRWCAQQGCSNRRSVTSSRTLRGRSETAF